MTEAKIATSAVTASKIKPTAGVLRGEGLEEAVAGVTIKQLLPMLELNPTTESQLLCWVTAYWRQEATEPGMKVGVRTKGGFGTLDTQAPSFSNGLTNGAGWYTATFFIVTAPFSSGKTEVFMTFQPQAVGGGSAWKIYGAKWSMMYLLTHP